MRVVAPIIAMSVSSLVFASVLGETALFNSPNGIDEKCTILEKVPGGVYSKKDIKKENYFCTLDLHADVNIGICPKTWSTSPGTIVYDLKKRGNYLDQKFEFEKEICGTSKTRAHKSVAKFKNTLNEDNTSGTFSKSSLLYYHMSRYLDTSVKVPVAVYREIDLKEHYNRVAKKGLKASKHTMIKAGWAAMVKAEKNPQKFVRRSTLFTDNYTKIYGILLKDSGERYGSEINGVRSAWGDKASFDFQETPAFRVMKNDKTILKAIEETREEYGSYIKKGLKKYKKGLFKKGNPEALRAVKNLQAVYQGIDTAQYLYWVKELSEITVLDYIFSQQDRIGNIDYKWTAYYVDEKGKLKSKKLDSEVSRKDMAKMVVPSEIAKYNPTIIQRSYIGDNDAGGRRAYSNFAKRTKMLEGIRHINEDLYERLKVMATDFEQKGQLYNYFANTFGLTSTQLNQLVVNTIDAFNILKSTCVSGKLKADIDPKLYMLNGTVSQKDLSCL